MPAYHHRQPRLDGLLLVKGFMELTFGVSLEPFRLGLGGAAHVAPLMRGDLAGPQMKQSGVASTRTSASARARGRGDRGTSHPKPAPGTAPPQASGEAEMRMRSRHVSTPGGGWWWRVNAVSDEIDKIQSLKKREDGPRQEEEGASFPPAASVSQAGWSKVHLCRRGRQASGRGLLVLDLCRTLLAGLLVLLAVGPLAVHATVFDQATGRAVPELDAVTSSRPTVGADFSAIVRDRHEAAHSEINDCYFQMRKEEERELVRQRPELRCRRFQRIALAELDNVPAVPTHGTVQLGQPLASIIFQVISPFSTAHPNRKLGLVAAWKLTCYVKAFMATWRCKRHPRAQF
ncbi:hypothetical protein THAOC_01730 [Thalassiosira oceanica]|uniref:Uncharacterized protein n=1 Tax=Thalassiosira oceanica TaxID=159749 RepID=K0THL7_THAOC|nr:hypothetical protein THAOC_01730 [Thalassiosira oceanica]|eukprot:EJK76504.1 hypothetical protein THAOC_01730 [Thalassiosira oceanica]